MNFFSHSLARLRYGAHINAARDWLVVLGFFALGFIAVLVWNIAVFDTVAQGGTLGAPSSSMPPIFSTSSLDTIRTIFTDRATEHAKFTTGVYRYTDPSR